MLFLLIIFIPFAFSLEYITQWTFQILLPDSYNKIIPYLKSEGGRSFISPKFEEYTKEFFQPFHLSPADCFIKLAFLDETINRAKELSKDIESVRDNDPYIYELQVLYALIGDYLDNSVKILLQALYYHAVICANVLEDRHKSNLDFLLKELGKKYQLQVGSKIDTKPLELSLTNFTLILPYLFSYLIIDSSKLTTSARKGAGVHKKEIDIQEPYFYQALRRVLGENPTLNKFPIKDKLPVLCTTHVNQFLDLNVDLTKTLKGWISKSNFVVAPLFKKNPKVSFVIGDKSIVCKEFFDNFIFSAFVAKVPLIPKSIYSEYDAWFISNRITLAFSQQLMTLVMHLKVQHYRLTFSFDENINQEIISILKLTLEFLKDIKLILLDSRLIINPEGFESFKILLDQIELSIKELKGTSLPTLKVNLPQTGSLKLKDSLSLSPSLNIPYEKGKMFEIKVFDLLEDLAGNYEGPTWIADFVYKIFGRSIFTPCFDFFDSFIASYKRLPDFSGPGMDKGLISCLVIADCLCNKVVMPKEAIINLDSLLKDEAKTHLGIEAAYVDSAVDFLKLIIKLNRGKVEMTPEDEFRSFLKDSQIIK